MPAARAATPRHESAAIARLSAELAAIRDNHFRHLDDCARRAGESLAAARETRDLVASARSEAAAATRDSDAKVQAVQAALAASIGRVHGRVDRVMWAALAAAGGALATGAGMLFQILKG